MQVKRFRYECKCGKDPLHGTFSTNKERHLLDAIDLAWAESHNRPGCTIKNKRVEAVRK